MTKQAFQRSRCPPAGIRNRSLSTIRWFPDFSRRSSDTILTTPQNDLYRPSDEVFEADFQHFSRFFSFSRSFLLFLRTRCLASRVVLTKMAYVYVRLHEGGNEGECATLFGSQFNPFVFDIRKASVSLEVYDLHPTRSLHHANTQQTPLAAKPKNSFLGTVISNARDLSSSSVTDVIINSTMNPDIGTSPLSEERV